MKILTWPWTNISLFYGSLCILRKPVSRSFYGRALLKSNLKSVSAPGYFFFKGKANGLGKRFYDEELPSSTFCCFFFGVLFVNVLILGIEIWRHVLDSAIHGVLVKLFSWVQILIFLACTAFHTLFYALWREGLSRKYFLRSVDTSFHEVILLFFTSNMDSQWEWAVCFFWSSRMKDIYVERRRRLTSPVYLDCILLQ